MNLLPYYWQMGRIAPWYLYDYQLPVYEFFSHVVDPFFEATRRYGKTTTKLVLTTERSIKQPGRITLWNEPWKEQARNIVIPEMEHIQETCPQELRAKFYRTDSFFEFPNGSRLYLFGVNEDKGEGARGRAADEIINDELGSWVHASYIRNEVMRPMLLTTRGEMTDMGTPPDDLGHLFYEIKAEAIASGRYIGRDIDSVTILSQEEKDRFIASMGGRQSTAVRRELYLEPVSDPERLVIPEFNESIHIVTDSYERPEYFDPIVGLDLGLNDNTFAVFGYWDFIKREFVIEDEYCAHGRTTREIVESCADIERRLWGKLDPNGIPIAVSPYLRVGDNEMQQLFDMQKEHGYLVSPTRKDDKLSALNALRLRFGAGKVKIKERCKNLIYQVKVGIWNERKTDFKRGEKTGHLDGIDALVYLHRNINEHRNPYPSNPGATIYTHMIPEHGSQGKEERQLADAFNPIAGAFSGFPE